MSDDVVTEASRLRRVRRRIALVAALVIGLVAVALYAAQASSDDDEGDGQARLAVCPTTPVHEEPPHPVGVEVSTWLCKLEAKEGDVVALGAARSDHASDVETRFSIVHTAPDDVGDGVRVGPVDFLKSSPVAGARVRSAGSADTGSWLLISVTPRQPGRWNVNGIVVTYRLTDRLAEATTSFGFVGEATAR